MKIVIINDMLWGGGRERRIVQLIAGLNRLGVRDITLILLDDRVDYPEVYDLDVEVIKIDRSSNRDFSVFPKLHAILKKMGPCIVNPWSYMSVFYAAPVCAALRLPCLGAFVVDAKPARPISVNWIAMRMGFLLCKKIVGNSKAGHDAYGTPLQKRVVIHNGYDEARLKAVVPASRTGSATRIAMIGRLDRQKDYRTYIDALAILKARGVDFEAFVAGQGADLEVLQAYAEAKCAGSVTFTGFIKNIDAFIAGIDIGALCTDPVFHAEGISNALMEMMAQGKPVVATDGGGTPEIIADGETGFLVPPHDPTALADKLELLCVNPGLRKVLGEASANTITTRFSLPRMASEFLQVYHDCL
ncbi:glycosyltransferase family 4 protein [Oryzibacter oryziterrae]|uniref:glycosyltransferase family 4 protein n=1 Tax=Oryzibacter oryziterrae TaxID=2766474 RepID=UPI001F45A70A|nr:glycosyltransferase family 4 protein [Oryzibacter oryziterrae]